VAVAVGFPDFTWSELQVEVAEDPNYVLDDDEVKEKAIEQAKKEFPKVEVAFLTVIYIEPLDYMEGLI
jgi:hypothetical protein